MSDGKTIQKWADEAMFTAEPIKADEGPKVYLLWMTPDPLAAIAAPCKIYKGEVARSLRDVTHKERQEYVQQLLNTKLQAPFEFVQFHFVIEGVTRAFTHQMVRQRTAAYAQESMRFAVKSERGVATPVGLPPSLRDTERRDEELEVLPDTERQRQRDIWEDALEAVDNAYVELIERGMPAEDARGLLPTNTLTRLHYTTNLRNLLDHAGNRLCTQAQFEWRMVFAKIAEAIRNYNPYAGLLAQLDNVATLGDDTHANVLWCYESDRWQYETLADLFRPVCYQTGKCEFKANFDRACSIRERVDTFEKHGVHSSLWDSEVFVGDEGRSLLPISPVEWLADPAAAR